MDYTYCFVSITLNNTTRRMHGFVIESNEKFLSVINVASIQDILTIVKDIDDNTVISYGMHSVETVIMLDQRYLNRLDNYFAPRQYQLEAIQDKIKKEYECCNEKPSGWWAGRKWLQALKLQDKHGAEIEQYNKNMKDHYNTMTKVKVTLLNYTDPIWIKRNVIRGKL